MYAIDALPDMRDLDILRLAEGVAGVGHYLRYEKRFFEFRDGWLRELSSDETKSLGLDTQQGG